MPSYAFPIAPPSPYSEKPAAKPYNSRRTQLQSTFSTQDPSHNYVVVSNLEQTDKQLGLNTKKTIIYSRHVQLGLRIAELLGAIGLLVCSACTTDLEDQQSFYLRTPPCIDAVTTAYAVYHLLRSATHTPPGPSSSYHCFASIIDICLIPFYVFITFLTTSELTDNRAGDGEWSSVFETSVATEALITATWLLAIIIAGLHVLTLLISVYLWLTFRRITRLPPDMNPLESHLTSRPRKTRKQDKDMNREAMSEKNPFSFLNSRSNGANNASQHSTGIPATASRLNLDLPPLPLDNPANEQALGTQSIAKRSINNRYNFSSIKSILRGSSMYSLNLYEDFVPPPLPRRSSKRRSEVMSDGTSTRDPSPQRDEMIDHRVSVVQEDIDQEDYEYQRQNFGKLAGSRDGFYPVASQNRAGLKLQDTNDHLVAPQNIKLMQPLHMNPPTPPLMKTMRDPLRTSSPNVPPRSPSRKPKAQSYGQLTLNESADLGNSESIVSDNTPWYSPAQSPVRSKKDTNIRVTSNSGTDIGEVGMPALEYTSQYHLHADHLHDGASDTSSGLGYKGASGVVLNGLRGRNVSGKLAEEGRSGANSPAIRESVEARDESGARATSGSWSGRWFGGRGW